MVLPQKGDFVHINLTSGAIIDFSVVLIIQKPYNRFIIIGFAGKKNQLTALYYDQTTNVMKYSFNPTGTSGGGRTEVVKLKN
ncbi:hypothetical protein A2533_02910 [Candidatus Falkowbacteria bacterium RIFOXYD2_FULL_35_9]|uniref:Uncharacterized protein n=1 Tax=Candidatus Falkowbacteria bacterium RIFOXYC2_FULL_36_12 TaxID=1798002 RepID=A0A1F5SYL4_9BACT|nr:MAG: hypothetical protein A2300_01515 [Candidatus Falkowbacteria bacterium RIFOXYB2_FULL_35_7]OGF31818.1 MAG: hypothetical protein A2478_05030 [Candidatus Falkowbacteria bacterium RIFOXYC2_FULL_36_12]OGF33774.1 MAG: hypothetical protein A2223_00160 [Candidatus Falkowbacteria bacterium RIFOXYA2_FULL_35_8]OGF46306.1 MAG: hypothetical protein A2533_02910 [Candidatus Falkowbacteria bacterium RIFOXYD2_FULL_35_9]